MSSLYAHLPGNCTPARQTEIRAAGIRCRAPLAARNVDGVGCPPKKPKNRRRLMEPAGSHPRPPNAPSSRTQVNALVRRRITANFSREAPFLPCGLSYMRERPAERADNPQDRIGRVDECRAEVIPKPPS